MRGAISGGGERSQPEGSDLGAMWRIAISGGSCLRRRYAVSGGGERTERRGAISGEGEHSQVDSEGSVRWFKRAISGGGERSQVEEQS